VATYKLIQDVEAEDHILGPLTLRQFIFALISAFCLYICFILVTKHIGFFTIIFLPPALFFGFFAIPFGRDQPTEIWALAKIQYFLKPRTRIWNQSGVKELVTVTAPKKIERALTNGLNPYEVQSRLTALASTLDSRGWAVKNAPLSSVGQNYTLINSDASNSDRLLDVTTLPQVVEDYTDSIDVLDETNSPISRSFEQMIDQSSKDHREQLIQQMNATTSAAIQPARSSNDAQWFMPKVDPTSGSAPVYAATVAAQDASPDEEALVRQLKSQSSAQNLYHNNLRTLQPISDQPGASSTAPQTPTQPAQDSTLPKTHVPDPAIISLANNDDLSVSTIAHEANKTKANELADGEVIISLH
jgi:hypothetical protein